VSDRARRTKLYPAEKKILPLPRRKEILLPTKRVSPYGSPPATFIKEEEKEKSSLCQPNRSKAKTNGQSATGIGTLKTDLFPRGLYGKATK
jgi:hypothetical protein